MPAEIIGALVGLIASSLLARQRDGARVPDWLGFINLAHVRTAAGGVFGLTATAGVTLSISNHSHHTISYVAWYGVAGIALVVVVTTTILIERGRAAGRRTASRHGAAAFAVDGRAPVGRIHEQHLHGWLERLVNAVNERSACPYPDDQGRQAIRSHFPDLTAPCDEWDAAVARADAAPVAAREQVERHVAEAHIPDGYNRDKLAEVIARFVVARPDYHVVLRAVRDEFRGDDVCWSVFTPSGRGTEVKIAELADAPVEAIQEHVSADEAALRAVVDGVRNSERIPEIAASRDALGELRRPLLDMLATKQAVSPILSAAACPYCQAQLQLAA
jgi:hypothetical protein